MTEPTDASSEGHDGWITSVITERVLPKDEGAFQEWATRVNAQLAAAEGFVGASVPPGGTLRADTPPKSVTSDPST